MRDLKISEMDVISGGVDYAAVGTGLASVGIGLVIASTPVGWVGIGGAIAFSFFGGYTIGTGLMDENDYAGGTPYN
ncbi:hypothetical protein DN062_10170 [Nitrincola tibetensis]|uniref:Bacteriocin n=1 Tax=Nitrincola tibetensis TaxID=2219697 RepID=A0A364NM11_9GAMM|nr:hypothetical protein [Nitrincola tibetensis]RAU18136.1 hypothetical protein DN062_10170 [Nitrincola tibetensis]